MFIAAYVADIGMLAIDGDVDEKLAEEVYP
jgi:hypothetical protein